jgi:dolichol-phosphate mannosyltransferase
MRTLIAIPVLNEAATLRGVLEKTRTFAEHVLVVDDGSTDGTKSILADAAEDLDIRSILHDANRGYGRTLVDAFEYAHAEGFEWVITMDCDEQHEPESIPAFVERIAAGASDIVSGSRYLVPPEDAVGAPPVDRRRINGLLTAEINARLGLSITDAFCGFKAQRVGPTVALGLTESGYAFPMQLWARAAAAGLVVEEIPVRLIYNDPNRTFGGGLDDAARRLAHYRSVLHDEICAHAKNLPEPAVEDIDCPCAGAG